MAFMIVNSLSSWTTFDHALWRHCH